MNVNCYNECIQFCAEMCGKIAGDALGMRMCKEYACCIFAGKQKRKEGENEMAVLGIFLYLYQFYYKGIFGVFGQVNKYHIVSWICGVLVWVRYLTKDDSDATAVGGIILDLFCLVDLVFLGLHKFFPQMNLSGIHLPRIPWEKIPWPDMTWLGELWATPVFKILLVVVCVILCLIIRPPFLGSTEEITAWLGTEAAVLALTIVIFYMSPVWNPYRGDWGFIQTLYGASYENPPTLLNIPTWSWRMKILLAVGAFTAVSSWKMGADCKGGHVLKSFVAHFTSYVAAVYLVMLFFLLRNHVFMVYFGFIYIFVELFLVTGFCLISCLLPICLLFPNTAHAINSATSRRSFGQSGTTSTDDMEEHRASHSLANMPKYIYDEDGDMWEKMPLYHDPLMYRCTDGSGRTVTIYNTSISSNGAQTDQGWFHWY